MRIVFMGSPSPAIYPLEALAGSGHQVVGVYTQPDKLAGRGRRPEQSPVKRAAIKLGLTVLQPESLRRDDTQEQLASLEPDVIVVAAYGKLLPPQVLNLPSLGCLNLHPSLLPKYRGPSPVASALLDGATATGVTIILLDEGMDTGPILSQKEMSVDQDSTTETLTTRLFQEGSILLMEILPHWERGGIVPQPQDNSRASVTRRLSKEDGEIDWRLSAEDIWRRSKAYYPWPGTYTYWKGKRLKIGEGSPAEDGAAGEAGTVVILPTKGLAVLTGGGPFLVNRLQLEGRKAVKSEEFLKGYPDVVGSCLPS